MNISELSQKIKTLYGKIKISQTSYEEGRIDPKKDWGVMLLFAFLLFVLSAVVSAYFYINVSQGTFFTTETAEGVNDIKINDSLFDKIVNDLDERENRIIKLRQGSIITKDPSI